MTEKGNSTIMDIIGPIVKKTLSSKVPGFEGATQEIKKALNIACESHGLNLGRHWVAYHSHRPIQGEDDDDHTGGGSSLKKIREMLVRKTHETYEPHFCKNINNECSFLAIVLRNIDTQDVVDYVLEFLWPKNRDRMILIESLLLTLKRCLPNFIHGSGAQLGDEELRVLDVDNDDATGLVGSFNVFRGKGARSVLGEQEDCISSNSSAPNHHTTSSSTNIHINNASLSTSKKRKRVILDHDQGSKPAKRKLSDHRHLLPKMSNFTYDSYQEEDGDQNENSTSSNSTVKSPNDVVDEMLIVAQLEDNMRLFHIPCTSNSAHLKKQISQHFGSLLSSETSYNLFFRYHEWWCHLESDVDLKECFDILKMAKHTYIQVRVTKC